MLPPLPVVSGWNGCTWVSWCSSAHQVRRLAASVPSSASLASTVTASVCPALNKAPLAGAAMRGTGGWLAGGSLLPPPHAASNNIDNMLPHRPQIRMAPPFCTDFGAACQRACDKVLRRCPRCLR